MQEWSVYQRQKNVVLYIAALVAAIWFGWQVIDILLLFFLAIVLTLILNTPTMWLMKKRIPRTGAALIVFFCMLVFLFLIAWLVIPKIVEQLNLLLTNLPDYANSLNSKLSSAFDGYPSIQKKINSNRLNESLPSAMSVVTRVGRFSLSVLSSLVVLVLFLSIVAYMLINPAPLIKIYLEFFSEKNRTKAANALSTSSTMLKGWMWSNLIVGSIEAVSVFIFLSIMNVPGVWVWAGLAIFSELIPKLGFYIMAIPPTLIALSIDPLTALWVVIFYMAMNELLGDFVMPRIRASTMNLHPVFTIILMLVMTSAFGLIGALTSTPLAAFVKAFYMEFYSSTLSKTGIDKQVEAVLEQKML